MENLHTRFDVVQEVLFQHYEQGSHKLSDHALFWEAKRREAIMLFFARKRQMPRLGFQPVPALSVSEGNAKDAIKMGLLLSSLQKSPYGDEPWRITDVSLEMLNTEPKDCFKKNGITVEVHYDNDPDNAAHYTSWSEIYYQNVDDDWVKVRGRVNYEGLFFVDEDGEERYYVRFQKDAERYGVTGMWRVHYKQSIISASVSSSGAAPAPSTHHAQTWWPDWPDAAPDSSTGSTGQRSSSSESREGSEDPWERRERRLAGTRRGRGGGRGGGRGRGPEASPSPAPTPSALPVQGDLPQSRQREEEEEEGGPRPHQACWENGGEGPSRGSGGIKRRGTGSRGRPPKKKFCRGGRQQGEFHTPSPPTLQSSSFTSPGGDFRGGPHPPRLSLTLLDGKVGGRSGQFGGHPPQGPGQAPAQAGGFPVIVLKGPGNSLKCFRLRCRRGHSQKFLCISTGYTWVCGEGDKVGRQRLMIGFRDEGQRSFFLKNVKIPSTFDLSFGMFDSL
ncbi:putative E2 protein [Canis familiaris papillomavirus 13]|uniref:Regulatory protein E2 n=1 Tax=Canis familiaris papillomavirus 13 TaxID=1226723 RepID=J7JMM2_9PAPI|nr:putative E2 protein [Canis familiaris papillomavirus 13]AFQ52495.1 putative E2 protein [Canis familiaris papillomavirus 13]